MTPTAHTSDTCNLCLRDGVPAAQARVRRPRQDTVICDTHGSLDADLNAACNIADRAGLTADPTGTRAGLGSSEAASAA
jgi:transposase